MTTNTLYPASLNAFGHNDLASPSVTIPATLLQDLLGTLQELKDEVAALREERAQDREELADLRQRIASLTTLQEEDVNRLALDIALDRQRLAKLERVEPQPLQRDRGEILRALLAANGGKMLAKDARQKMRLSKNRFSELLGTCDFLETKKLHYDKRNTVIILKSELVPRN